MTSQTETTQRNHHRAVRFFWCFLIGATTVSLIGNIVHAIWHLISFVVIQIGTAAVPPLFLLAVVHGIALSVRAGASGTVYRCAVMATAVIGVGAFVLSFRALRDLVIHTGIPPAWAWLFPAIIDTAIGVSTLMLVALGDKPAHRTCTRSTQIAPLQRLVQGADTRVSAPARRQVVKPSVAQTPVLSAPERAQTSARSVPNRVASAHGSAHTTAQADDADLASGRPVTARRSMLRPRHRGSTTGLRSGSWRLQQSTGRGSSWRSAEGVAPYRVAGVSRVKDTYAHSARCRPRFRRSSTAFNASLPHWYLAVIGSDPVVRGAGFGHALMRSRLDRVDAEHAPAYLESTKSDNVPYYQRFGFVVTGGVVLPDGGPTRWPMWRVAA